MPNIKTATPIKARNAQQRGFHSYSSSLELTSLIDLATGTHDTTLTYTFHNHFHPFIGELLAQLNKGSVDGLLDAEALKKLEKYFFDSFYKPVKDNPAFDVVSFPEEIDVSKDGAYSVYNWELLFHIPLAIAVHLSKNQRFAEAQHWFHYIFDPTADDGSYWRFIAFGQQEDTRQIDELMRLLGTPTDELDSSERKQKEDVINGYDELLNNPFQPHVVARTRPLAYQYSVVMKYLDNLIDWGDSLFRQDTIEAINEATQIYVLAADILGPRPQHVPKRGTHKAKTFAQLRKNGLGPLGNALVELEGQFPLNLHSPNNDGDNEQAETLFGIGRMLYFCVPHNDKLLSYWDTVADRLFKIRHCMNMQGVVRQLPLFEPPIDPGMLAKAAAAGIDTGSLISGLNQPLAPVRSSLLTRKALEICAEVRSLGNALLSALEKKDAEALGLLRQRHATNIQELAQEVSYMQWQGAKAATRSLLTGRESAVERYRYYQRLLGGAEEDVEKATSLTLERSQLTEENFDEVYGELVEQYAQDMGREEYPGLDVIDEGRLYLNKNEDAALNEHEPESRSNRSNAKWASAAAGAAIYIPKVNIDLHYWGLGSTIEAASGEVLATASRIAADIYSADSSLEASKGASATKSASYERRAAEWMLQSNLAAHELMQIGRRIISSLIQEEVTRHQYENQKKQIEQARELDQFLHDKFTSEQLYGWMQGELSKLYYEYYKFAFDTARTAEQTMKHELMRPEMDDIRFIKFNYWDSGRKGLLSGEALQLDLKRMEMAYHEHNKREYELTRHVSLRQLDPVALLKLKASGSCEVSIPEWLFDMDCPGHYMRRIKTASLSIPAVAGPYTSINCTLSLLKSTVRKSPDLSAGTYARALDEEDERFVDYYGAIESVVTSNGTNDGGLFETNLHDERFLPFEGAGVESTWRLELPSAYRQFDYNTISDVILSLDYTARQGGEQLATASTKHLDELVTDATSSGLARLFSLPHEFPDQWNRFTSGNSESFAVTLQRDFFPYFIQGRNVDVKGAQLFGINDGEVAPLLPPKSDLGELPEDGMELTLFTPDDNILAADKDVVAFLLIHYALRN